MGSTSLVTDDTGLIVEETFYEPFGSVESGGNVERKLYTGHEQDDTGQTYMKARYYLSETGQFISPDMLLPNVYDPQSLNRYSYVRNIPMMYIDPSKEIKSRGGFIVLFFLL